MLERPHGVLVRRERVEDLRQPGDSEDVRDARLNPHELHVSTAPVHADIPGHQEAQAGAIDIGDVLQVQDEL